MDLNAILRQLGYTEAWLACGVIDEAFLREQYDEYLSSEDKNPEHYRAHAFTSFLARSKLFPMNDDLLDSILHLPDLGPDGRDLNDSRIIAVVESAGLTDEQLSALPERCPRVLEPPLQRRYLRESLRRKIHHAGVDANFDQVKTLADSQIQLEVLDHSELAKPHVEWLAASGSNKAIRNRATELLRSGRFRDG